MRSCVRGLLSMVVLAGCGSQQSLPDQPQISVSPSAILFDSDNGGSWYVGGIPSPQDGVVITDQGQTALTINKVTLTGDSAFTLVMPTPGAPNCDGGASCQKLTINRPPDTAVVLLQFAPTATKIYHATVTITSNGTNDGGTLFIPVTAVGVTRVDGG
jgi:hypothetical protein